MGLFKFIDNFKENRRRHFLTKQMKDDREFAWEHLMEVANEMKLRVKNDGRWHEKEIRGKFCGFDFYYCPHADGYLAIWEMSIKRGLDVISDCEYGPDNPEHEKFETGDEEFDEIFTQCYASPEIQSQLKAAGGLRNQMVKFHRTWLGGGKNPNKRHLYFELENHDLGLQAFPESVPGRAYHIGEDRPLDDPDEFKAAVRDFFADLQALLEDIEQTLGDARYVDVSPKKRARRERLDLELIAIIDDANEDDLPGEVKKLLEQGADPNARSDTDQTPLKIAGRDNHHQVIKTLLDAGAEVNAADPSGETALMAATEHYSLQAVKILLEKGADATAVDHEGKNALMYATGEEAECNIEEENLREMFKLMIDAGIDINAVSEEGETALSRAEDPNCDQELVVEVLKELGAER